MNNNISVDYYNKNAQKFINSTQTADFSEMQENFRSYVPIRTHILDFGCGAGRDTKAFIESGYIVDAIDGSIEMVKVTKKFCDIEVKQVLFEKFVPSKLYDGIWAYASLLHLSKKELRVLFPKLQESLKMDGILYVSFKNGTFEGIRNERQFTVFNEMNFKKFIKEFDFTILDIFVSSDVRSGRDKEQCLNVFLKKGNL